MPDRLTRDRQRLRVLLAVSAALGFLIGFCLGLLGGGGAIVTVP